MEYLLLLVLITKDSYMLPPNGDSIRDWYLLLKITISYPPNGVL